jgi:predicted nuclease of predicted toxin-antitoxin system
VNQRPDARLLLDEMFSPAIAAELRERGHDVIAVADRPDLRAKSDEEIFAWASTERRWLLTENVKDFRPIMLRALPGGPPGCGLLFTSSRAFPRSRKNPGPLINALHAWLTAGSPAPPVTESWLLGAPGEPAAS